MHGDGCPSLYLKFTFGHNYLSTKPISKWETYPRLDVLPISRDPCGIALPDPGRKCQSAEANFLNESRWGPASLIHHYLFSSPGRAPAFHPMACGGNAPLRMFESRGWEADPVCRGASVGAAKEETREFPMQTAYWGFPVRTQRCSECGTLLWISKKIIQDCFANGFLFSSLQ